MSRKKLTRLVHTADNEESRCLTNEGRCPEISSSSPGKRRRGRPSLASLAQRGPKEETIEKNSMCEKNSGDVDWLKVGSDPIKPSLKENIIFRGPATRTRNRMTNQDISDFLLPYPRKRKKHIRGRQRLCPICGVMHSSKHSYHCVVCCKAFMLKRSQQNHHYLFHGITEGMSLVHIKSLAGQRKKRRPFNEENKVVCREKQVDNEMEETKCPNEDVIEKKEIEEPQPMIEEDCNQCEPKAEEIQSPDVQPPCSVSDDNVSVPNTQQQQQQQTESVKFNFNGPSIPSVTTVERYNYQYPYHCIICNKGFKWKRSQQNHQYLFHDISEGMSQVHIRSLAAQKRRKQGLGEENKTDVSTLAEISKFSNVNSCADPVMESCGWRSDADIHTLKNKPSSYRGVTFDVTEASSTVDSKSKPSPDETGKDALKSNISNDSSLPSKAPEQPANTQSHNYGLAAENELRCEECCRQFRSPYSLYFHRKTVQHRIKADYAQGEKVSRNKDRLATEVPPTTDTTNTNGVSTEWCSSSPAEKQVVGEDAVQKLVAEPVSTVAPSVSLEKNDSIQHVVAATPEEGGLPKERTCQTSISPDNKATVGSTIREYHSELDERSFLKNGINGGIPATQYYRPHREAIFPPPPSVFLPNSYMLAAQNPNDKKSPFIWQSINIQSEKVLVTKLEGINPTTEQRYFLYKCCICGSAFPGLDNLCTHLLAHSRNNREFNCEKCGAVFKWRSQLEVHEQVHQVVDSKLAVAPPLSSSYVFLNPFNNIGVPMMVTPLSHPAALSELGPQAMSLPHPPPAMTVCHDGANFLSSPVPPDHSVLAQILSNPTPPGGEVEKPAYKRFRKNRQKYPFLCSYCSKSFDRVFSLQRHERIHTGIKPCFCRVCGRGFSEKRNLRHHIIRFHSDSNQRDLRRRMKSVRPRNNSLKLVSFLKRTAVRILNSIDQNKLDSQFAERYKPIAPPDRKLPIAEDNRPQYPSATISEDKCLVPNMTPCCSKPVEESRQESVTVVIPTEVPDNTSKPPSTNAGPLERDSRQVLEDPKRSLIGNRRKGRPFKYTPSQGIARVIPGFLSSEHAECPLPADTQVSDNAPHMDNGGVQTNSLVGEVSEPAGQPDTQDEARAPDAKAKNTELDPSGNHQSDIHPSPPGLIGEPQLGKDDEDVQGELHGEHSMTFKARLRGHGAFFSSYNPRLGVVDKPVARAEACKPQVGPDGRYVYPCSYCLKAFCSMSDLNRHMDFHEDIRPFKCPFCSYSSRTNSQLKVHMMRHQGIKQFLCHICNYNGVTQSDLNRHCRTRTHILRIRNICSTCGLGFYTKTHLDGHILLFHQPNSQREPSASEVNSHVESSTCSDHPLPPPHPLVAPGMPLDIYNMPPMAEATSCVQQESSHNSGQTNNAECHFNSDHVAMNS